MKTETIEAAAKAIYEGICAEGIEECFHGIPYEELPEHVIESYEKIARAVLKAASVS